MCVVAVGVAAGVNTVSVGAAETRPGVDGPRAPVEAPRPLAPPATGPDGRPGGPVVREEPLDEPGDGAAGLLTGPRGGFGLELWRDTPHQVVAEGLERLPAPTRSTVTRSLARRLLVSVATPPAGSRADSDRLLVLRMQALYRMGLFEDVEALHAAAGEPERAVAYGRVLFDALLLHQGPREACTHREILLPPASGSPETGAERGPRDVDGYAERATIACHALTGDHERARMGLALMEERDSAAPPPFVALVEAVRRAGSEDGTRDEEEAGFDLPDALAVALLGGTALPIPEAAMEIDQPPLLRGLATLSNPPAGRRIAVAERAAATGALPVDRLAALYESLDFGDRDLDEAIRIHLRDYGPTARGLLYRAAGARTAPDARMQVLATWWRLALANGDFTLVARMTREFAAGYRPDPRWKDQAEAIARVHLAVGEEAAAGEWYAMLRAAPFRDGEALARLGALTYMAGVAGEYGVTELQAWVDQQRRRAPDEASARIARLYALLDGLGLAAPFEAVWLNVLADEARETAIPARWREARSAASSGRLGAAVMSTLHALDGRDLGEIPPGELRQALLALRQVGLAAEARSLAVEAALLAGL